ncbi:endonuclease iii [Nannochloropsis oceanica]
MVISLSCIVVYGRHSTHSLAFSAIGGRGSGLWRAPVSFSFSSVDHTFSQQESRLSLRGHTRAAGAENEDGTVQIAAADPVTPPAIAAKEKSTGAEIAPRKKTKNISTSSIAAAAPARTIKPKAVPKPKKAASPPFSPHPLWQQQLEHIRKMREAGPAAPVDLFGCAELGKRHATSPEHMRLQTLISSMLSSQTTDLVNEKAMGRLYEACGITIEGLEELGEEGIGEVIKPVSFYTAKSANIIKVCKILKEEYAGDIPRTFEDLMSLPGVGPKMAILVCAYGWGEVVGICVDTHVHRISNRLGWANTWNYKNPKAQNPEKTRKLLESWMPRENWEEVNPLLVGLGQQTCRAVNPKCWECSLTAICPSYLPPV